MKSIKFIPMLDGTTRVLLGSGIGSYRATVMPVSTIEFHGHPCDPDHVFRSIQSLAEAFEIAKRFDGLR